MVLDLLDLAPGRKQLVQMASPPGRVLTFPETSGRCPIQHGLDPAPGSVGNFVYVDLGEDVAPLFERLLQQGVIIRPLAGFGAPTAVRITVGTPHEHAFLDAALGRVRR